MHAYALELSSVTPRYRFNFNIFEFSTFDYVLSIISPSTSAGFPANHQSNSMCATLTMMLATNTGLRTRASFRRMQIAEWSWLGHQWNRRFFRSPLSSVSGLQEDWNLHWDCSSSLYWSDDRWRMSTNKSTFQSSASGTAGRRLLNNNEEK